MAEAFLMNHNKDNSLRYKDNYTDIGNRETIINAAFNGAGYFGTVPSSQLFTGSELSMEVGFSVGTLLNDDVEWMKFYLDGKILFRPKVPFRYNISYTQVNNIGSADGTKTVTKGGVTFKVRLHSGTNDEREGLVANGSEYSRLIFPLLDSAGRTAWLANDNSDSKVKSWDINFTREELGLAGTGRYVICKRSVNSASGSTVFRQTIDGKLAVINVARATADHGWYPILEVVPN